MSRSVHFVGSIPMADATAVFETVSQVLGDRLVRLPDGETTRTKWVGSLEDIFAGHPDFVRAGAELKGEYANESKAHRQYEVRKGVDPSEVSFKGHLPQAREAIANYQLFAQKKADGTIPSHVRYQVQFSTSTAVLRSWVIDQHRSILEPVYDVALSAEIDRLCAEIPHDQLAIQWDVASSVFFPLEVGKPTRYGTTVPEMLEFFGSQMSRLGEHVPDDVELAYHLCYGNQQNKHSVEPRDMSMLVAFANYLCGHVSHPIALIHMPVPRDRNDDRYFEPLQGLKLNNDTELALGLVHLTDGVEGSLKRAHAAQRYVQDFLVAAECGFGRRDPETVPELLRIHAEVADAI